MRPHAYARSLLGILAIIVAGGCGTGSGDSSSPASIPTQSFVEVVPGVHLEVLEWGGEGPALLLLPGATLSAWSYEQLAPHFTDRRTVLSMTRRNHGYSDAWEEPFGMPELVNDIVTVLDAFSIERADVIGHSFGGYELTQLLLEHPQRVRKAVYLDGAWDFYEVYTAEGWFDGWPDVPLTPADSASPAAVAAQMARVWGALYPVSDIRATHEFDADGRLVQLYPGAVSSMFEEMILPTLSPLDFDRISTPILSIQAIPENVKDQYPSYDSFDADTKRMADASFAKWLRVIGFQSDRFAQEVEGVTVLKLLGANHGLPVTDPERFVSDVRAFLFQ